MKLLKGQHLLLTDGSEVTYVSKHTAKSGYFLHVVLPNGKLDSISEGKVKANLGPHYEERKPMKNADFIKLTPMMFDESEIASVKPKEKS